MSGPFRVLARAGAGRFRRSPARLACLLLVAAGAVLAAPLANGMPSAWGAAGDAAKGAATVAGLLACGWGAGAVLDDREAGCLEQAAASGCGAVRYLAARLAPPLAALALAGAAGIAAVWAVRLAVAGQGDPVPFLAAFAVVHLPVILFAACFGACAATLSRSRALALVLFAALWIVGGLVVLGTPSPLRAFDVTGLALDETYFQPPLTADSLADLPPSLSQAAAASAAASRFYGRFNLPFLLGGAAACAAVLAVWLARGFRGRALSLVPEGDKRKLLVPVPTTLVGLKAMRLGRLAAVALATLALGTLALAAPDPKAMGTALVESLTPLAFAFAFAGVYAADAAAGTAEGVLALARFRRPYVRRLAVVAAVLAAVLAFQAAAFHGFMEASTAAVLLMGLAPSVLLGGAAFLAGTARGSESAAVTAAALLWAVLHLPFASALTAVPGLGLLYPFPATMGVDAGVGGRAVVLLAGLLLLGAGLWLLKDAERRLER